MSELLSQLIIICPLVFLAGFVDSVAGGGGLISLPAYLFCGIPPHVASGTNKVVNGIGTAVAAVKYFRSGTVKLRVALIVAVFALVGSTAGTRLALLLSDSVLNIVLLCALPIVAIVFTVKKDFGQTERSIEARSQRRDDLISAAIGLSVGCYDGLIGPGTGTLLTMAFSAFLGMSLLNASGTAKIGNLASNIASAVLWISNDCVLFSLVVPAACCNMLGNYLGARCAIKGGSKWIRSMIFVVLGLLFIKVLVDII